MPVRAVTHQPLGAQLRVTHDFGTKIRRSPDANGRRTGCDCRRRPHDHPKIEIQGPAIVPTHPASEGIAGVVVIEEIHPEADPENSGEKPEAVAEFEVAGAHAVAIVLEIGRGDTRCGKHLPSPSDLLESSI